MTAPTDAQEPDAGAPITPMSIPLFVTAGPVNGIALAICRDAGGLHYLVDNAPVDGPPLWVHEAEIDRCEVAPLGQLRT
jgi:hypothetical protein